MPKYTPSIPIQDCYGSVGELTYYHKNGQCFYRKRSSPAFPGTASQLAQQAVHLRAIAAWQSLEPSVQREWNTIAPSVVVHKPPFDGKAHMSGYNLFVSAYHGFATLGMEKVPLPVPWVDFPSIVLEELDSVSIDGTDLMFRVRAYIEEVGMANTCRCLLRAQLVAPGKGRNPGRMRNILSVECGLPGSCNFSFVIPDYVNAYGLDLQEYTLHCRFMLLDFRTGYRNQWKPASFPLKI